MALDPVVEQRMFKNMFICMRCNARNRASEHRMRLGKVRCRKCGYGNLRVRKKGSGKSA